MSTANTLAQLRLRRLHEANTNAMADAYAEAARRFADDLPAQNAWLAGWLQSTLESTQRQLASILSDEF